MGGRQSGRGFGAARRVADGPGGLLPGHCMGCRVAWHERINRVSRVEANEHSGTRDRAAAPATEGEARPEQGSTALPAPVWSYATIWESVAWFLTDATAVSQGSRSVSWREFDRTADALAASLVAAGLRRQSKVAAYMQNRPEFLMTYFAAFKAGLAPFNVNYRYTARELHYLIDNADAEAIVFDHEFLDRVEEVRGGFAAVALWVVVGCPQGACPPWAVRWEDATAAAPGKRPFYADWGRGNDDVMMIYTGGTTGMPKGVVWRLHDLIARGNFGANPVAGVPPLERPEEAGPRAAAAAPIRPRSLIAPPLMHATGLIAAFGALTNGGTVVLLPPGKFSAAGLLDTVEAHKVTRMTVVGEPFTRPILDALEAQPARWDVSSVVAIGSSGAMWTRETKEGLLRHMPNASLVDSYSSSEAMGMGSSTTTASGVSQTARFELSPSCAVFTEDHRRVEPGSGEPGLLAVGGFNPLGYYKDEEKTAKTFPMIEGQRWCMPGDWALVNADGSLEILGRGSQCINTGGEKVFPEEVEEALRRHAAVRDVAVTGVPDPRFGERIVAVVELAKGAADPGDEALARWVRTQLADYKVPRAFVRVNSVGRAPNGKLDYQAVRTIALAAGEIAPPQRGEERRVAQPR